MSIRITGIVKDGIIVPNTPLPEGAHVEICVHEAQSEMPAELREELAAWQRASADALDLVERMAGEPDSHEAR